MIDKIGNKIKTLRKQNNLSQTNLAKKLNLTQDSISLWENNKGIPSTIYVIELSKIFGISTDYLLGLETEDGTKIYNNYGQDFRNSNFNHSNININKKNYKS